MGDTFRTILGVRFYIGDVAGLLDRIAEGGLVVVPSAPVMVRLADDAAHREALECADLAITDSGLMVLLWLLRTGERIRRISGLRLLRALVDDGKFRCAGESLWVMPTAEDAQANLRWLKGRGFQLSQDDAYVAPVYARAGPLSDGRLLELVRSRRPRLIVIGLSGGVQERLGWHLRSSLGYKPCILCIGGAIAFLSGQQAAIPVWADRLGLGWAIRFASSPRSFSNKVKGIGRLAPLIWAYGSSGVTAK